MTEVTRGHSLMVVTYRIIAIIIPTRNLEQSVWACPAP